MCVDVPVFQYGKWVKGPQVLSPAHPGYERKRVLPDLRKGCTFQTVDGLCEIHAIKPFEGRANHHNRSYGPEFHAAVGECWMEAKVVVREWNG